MTHSRIQRFEWEKLTTREPGFTGIHHKALVAWQERQQAIQKPGEKATYFNVGVDGVTFTQWVGVIQVKDLTIEVLPKAESTRFSDHQEGRNQAVKKWGDALLGMLQMAGKLPIRQSENADLNARFHSLLDLYFAAFLDQVETLIHQGLVKTYHRETANRTALKGKLDFAGQIRKNMVHQERFYTTANHFDRDNPWNRILFAALDGTVKNCRNGAIRSRAQNLKLAFPEWQPEKIQAIDFDRLVYSRKTDGYQPAMTLARLILLEMNPTISSGKENVIALFFDMNVLWEEYLLARLRRGYRDKGYSVGKSVKDFWGNDARTKRLEPDIRVKRHEEPDLIVDAKWKIPTGNAPADPDIKQMFAYNLMWGCRQSWLAYPATDGIEKSPDGTFENMTVDGVKSSAGKMGMWFVPLFNEQKKLERAPLTCPDSARDERKILYGSGSAR